MNPQFPPANAATVALRIALPIVVLALVLAIWEAVVRIWQIPPYVLPAPGLIAADARRPIGPCCRNRFWSR